MPQPVFIPIYDGDDLDRLSDLRRAWEIAKRNAAMAETVRRVGDDTTTAVTDAEQAYRDFEAEAAERAELWQLRHIGHAEFRALLRDHPPRQNDKGELDPEDAPFGVNVETFGQPLLTYVDPDDPDIRTVVAPHEGAALKKRLKQLSAGEFDTLWVNAFQVNTGGVANPKAGISSTGSPSTDET